MIEISGKWYMEKITKGLPPLRRQKIIRKSQNKFYEIIKTI